MKIKNDLNEMAGDALGQIKSAVKLIIDPSEAPPTIRKQDIGFVTLRRKNGDTSEPVGCFFPELYELAKVNSLKCQVEFDEWNAKEDKDDLQAQPFYEKLFRADGQKKTPFELGVLPFIFDDNKQKSKDKIQRHLEKEFHFIQEHNRLVKLGAKQGKIIKLPAPVNKYRIGAEYLKYVEEIGLEVSAPRDLKLNLLNPGAKTTLLERTLHWIGQRTSILMTVGAALTASYMSVISVPLAIIAVLGTILAKWSATDFGNFDLAETLYRESDWLSSEELRTGETISAKKLLKTSILFLAVASGIGAAALASWEIGMAFSISGLGIVSSLVQYSIASLLATIGIFSTITGGITTQRFFWGTSIWDNQIQLSKECIDALPALETPLEVPLEAKAQVKAIKQAHKAARKADKDLEKDEIKAFVLQFQGQRQQTEEEEFVIAASREANSVQAAPEASSTSESDSESVDVSSDVDASNDGEQKVETTKEKITM